MRVLLTCTPFLALALIAAAVNGPGTSKSAPATQSPSRPGLGGVVPPLDLSVESPLDRVWEKPRAHSEPHGHQACATGCAVSHHPTPRLTRDRCRALLAEYQQTPFALESASLDALLYYGAQTRFQLRQASLRDLLDAKHLTFLERELSRERAIVSLRLIDQHGNVRAECPATEVPQHVRQVFKCDVYDLQPLVSSGTVKRVGKNHIWQRL